MLYSHQASNYEIYFKRRKALVQLKQYKSEAQAIIDKKLGGNFKVNHLANSICKLRTWTVTPILINGFEYTGRTLVIFMKLELHQQYQVSKTDDCKVMYNCIEALKQLIINLKRLTKKDCEFILKTVKRHEVVSKITERKKLLGTV